MTNGSGSAPDRKDEHDTEQEGSAAELADRAAESVDRRYDATKEIYHGEREGHERQERERRDQQEQETEKD